MQKRLLLDSHQIDITIRRLCFQLIENHDDFSNSVIIGIQTRGVFLAKRIHTHLTEILKTGIKYGNLDTTFYRDDFRRREMIVPGKTDIDFIIENQKVILIDDVFYTGRTARAGLDALLDYGRPEQVELLTLVERRYSRQLPIVPDYSGVKVDTIMSEKIDVEWKELEGEDAVYLN